MEYTMRPPSFDALNIQTQLKTEGYGSLLSAVLVARGIQNIAEAQALLNPQNETLHDPFLMQDMSLAVTRIQQAIADREQIVVYGDYDVDGITSTSLLTAFLQAEGGDASYYIPYRLGEGYGLNKEAIEKLAQRGVGLIVTVDCGITAVDEVNFANSLGVDVVITDHHACKDILPSACAVVDPHRPDCLYPFKGLAGVGVAFKLILAMAGHERQQEIVDRYIAIVALGTIADVMPMVGENRSLVRRGLLEINANPPMGLSVLMREAGLGDKPISTVGVGYTLAPRLNASGRMGRADLAVELLLTSDAVRSYELALELGELNRQRQTVESEILTQCIAQLEKNPPKHAILLWDEGWHQGVVGIVASRLAERYGLPTFIICMTDGVGKGSCRSWGGVNLFALLDSGKEYLVGFGGHALAAGFTVAEDQIEALHTHLCKHVNDFVVEGEEKSLLLDCSVTAGELTVDAIAQLEALEPCGNSNPRPMLLLQNAIVRQANAVGQGRHLKLRVERDGIVIDAIWFSAGARSVFVGSRVDVAFYPQVNEFRGATTPQMQVIDLCPCQSVDIYAKYFRGEPLSCDEAKQLIPERDVFVRLWRYLKEKSLQMAAINDTVAHLCTVIDQPDSNLPQVKICLDIMEERGLIDLATHTTGYIISLNKVDGKVNLEDSAILRRLRAAAGGNS